MPKTKDMAMIFFIALIASLVMAWLIGHNEALAEFVAIEQD